MKKLIINKPGRYDIKLILNKNEERVEWLGIIDARKSGDYEINLLLEHKVWGTYGRVLMKGVAGGGAKVKVRGLVRIENEAQDTDSFLSIKMLVLDNKSSATADPEMEIMANKVKASHSASISRIDEEQLFYLESRGVNRQDAKDIIVKALLI